MRHPLELTRLGRFLGLSVLLAVLPAPDAPAAADEGGTAARLTVVAMDVDPDAPRPDTLCTLRATVRNAGRRVASGLRFAVTIDGQALPVYENQLFFYALEPGEVTVVPLYNFWTTETSRPAPADGELTIAVTLEEATWIDISADGEGAETWKSLGPVEGLPSRASITLPLR